MAKHEIKEIIDSGLRALSMKIEIEASNIIVSLSRGYPYYAHLLCYESTIKAIKSSSERIQKSDVASAIKMTLKNAVASVQDGYLKAVEGQRTGATYPLLLLGSALAKTDEFGYFKATDVRSPVSQGEGEATKSDYSERLNKLATDESRGLVLERRGVPRRYKFRFRDPLLKPYIIMKGISDGLVNCGFADSLAVEQPKQKTLFDCFE